MTHPRDYALPDPSLDPEAQRIAWERDRNERGWRHMMGSAIQAGQRAGKAMLTRQLTKKFGPLAEAQRERVEAPMRGPSNAGRMRLLTP